MRNIFIRKDWLDKLGLKVPTNIDEFHDVLIAFRNKDPGNVGKNRVIPFFQGSDAHWGLADLIANSFTKGMSDRDIWINSIAGQAGERSVNKPGFKEGVRNMNQWYNEKLIYQDFPIQIIAAERQGTRA